MSLVARGAIHGGDRLLIAVTRGRETKVRRVALCSRSPCPGRWSEQGAISDRFQAFVTRGSGKAFAVVGKSRVVRVTWTAPPPAPPPPAAQGHYQGSSSFGEIFGFDVSADGKSIVNLETGQIRESCNPSGVTLSGGSLSFPGPIPIAEDGTFVINTTFGITIDFPDGSVAGSRTVSITGRFTGGTAAGTMKTDTSLSHAGTTYVCNSGDQTWTVSKA